MLSGTGVAAIHTDDTAFTPGTGKVAPAGYLFDDVATDTVDEGDVGVARMSGDRIAYARVQDGHNVALGATADAAATTDTGTFSKISLFKRLLQKFTTQFPAALTASGNFKVSIAESTATGIGGTILHSTTANLGVGGVFTGAFVSVKDYAQVTVNVKASHDSASQGLVVDWSDDGVTVHRTEKFTVLANVPRSLAFRPKGEQARVVYTNGGTGQTTFSLESIGHSTATRVESRAVTLRSTLPISTSPGYSQYDSIGGKLTFANVAPVGATQFIINKVAFADKAFRESGFVVFFFRADPSASTITDNAALDIHDDDLFKLTARVQLNTVDWEKINNGDTGYADITNVNEVITLDGTDLFVAIMVRNGKQFLSTTDLQLEISLLPVEN